MSAATPVTDDLGHEVGVAAEVRRIVSLVPNLSELLWTWGMAELVVGVTDWCVAPPDGFPLARRVRGTKNPDLTAIAELGPDLVLANEEENRRRDVERLREAGLAVHVTRVRSVSSLPGTLTRLEAVLRAPGAADGLVRALAAARSGLGPPTRSRRVACAVWRDAPEQGGDAEGWWLLGRDTYAAELLAATGMQVVPSAPDGRYPRCSFAELRALEPELVLLPDEPYAFGPVEVEALAAAGLDARLVDGRDLWWWGPRTPQALTRLAAVVR